MLDIVAGHRTMQQIARVNHRPIIGMIHRPDPREQWGIPLNISRFRLASIGEFLFQPIKKDAMPVGHDRFEPGCFVAGKCSPPKISFRQIVHHCLSIRLTVIDIRTGFVLINKWRALTNEFASADDRNVSGPPRQPNFDPLFR